MSNIELMVALQNIETDYYRDSANFDTYSLEEYTEMMLDEYMGV